MITEKDSSCIANESQENQLLSLLSFSLLSTWEELVSPLFHSTLLLWLSWLQKLSPIDFPLWLTLNGLGSLGATTTAKKPATNAALSTAPTFGIQSLHDDALPWRLQKGSKTPLRFIFFHFWYFITISKHIIH